MDANQTSELILSNIKMSNLNFNIMESPFSLTITIKKSFIKNKDGTLRKSGFEATSLGNTQQDPISSPVQLTSANFHQAFVNPRQQDNNHTSKQQPLISPKNIKQQAPPPKSLGNPAPNHHDFPSPNFPIPQNYNKLKQALTNPKTSQHQLVLPTHLNKALYNPMSNSQTWMSTRKKQDNQFHYPANQMPSFPNNQQQLVSNTTMQQTSFDKKNRVTLQQQSHTNTANFERNLASQTSFKLYSTLPAISSTVSISTLPSSTMLQMTAPTRHPPPLFSSPRSRNPPSKDSSWEHFPFKLHPDVPSSDDDDSYREESVQDFMKRMKMRMMNLKKE